MGGRTLVYIFKKVGPIGFLMIVAFVFFWWKGTPEQHKEFIDQWFLLKKTQQNPISCVMVVVFLLFALVLGSIYHHTMMKIRKEENNRIGKEKSELQEALLNKKLNTSDEGD